MNFSDLPPEMKREVQQALDRMRAEQADAPPDLRGLRYSALRPALTTQLTNTDSVSVAQKFSGASAEAIVAAAAATTTRRIPRLSVTSRLAKLEFVEVVPCQVFPTQATVVVDAEVLLEARPALRGDAAAGAPVVASLSVKWRSLHFAPVPKQQPSANGDDDVPEDQVSLQSMRLRSMSAWHHPDGGADPVAVRRPFAGLPLAAFCIPPSGADNDGRRDGGDDALLHAATQQHLDGYTRPLLHLAMAEVILRFNGRTKVAQVAAELLRNGQLRMAGNAAATIGALARGTGVDIRAAAADGRAATAPARAGATPTEAATLSLPGGTWVVLGLGAGAIPAFLASALPVGNGAGLPKVATLEIEPSVVFVNRMHLGYDSRAGTSLVTVDAVAAVGDSARWEAATGLGAADEGAPVIFLDCYDPIAADMLAATELLRACRTRLRPGGVLAVNAHMNAHANPSVLWPFVEAFGASHLQVGLVDGYQQALVLCTRPFGTDAAADDAVEEDPINAGVPPSTLRGVWDVHAVCRLASHGDVRLDVGGQPATRASVVEGDGSAPLRHLVGDEPEERGALGWAAYSWLDPTVVTQSSQLTVKPPIGTATGAAPVKVRRWLIAS